MGITRFKSVQLGISGYKKAKLRKIDLYLQWQLSHKKLGNTRHVSSMIYSARPIVLPVVNIVFAWNLFCFENWDGRTYEQTTCAKTMITTGRDCGSASWINYKHSLSLSWLLFQLLVSDSGRLNGLRVRKEIKLCNIMWVLAGYVFVCV